MGSFLNVVAWRLPRMMKHDWKTQCQEFLELPAQATRSEPAATLSLSRPRSSCPHCGHQITALENIPVLSYLLLGGKCSACKTAISMQYPLVELITAVLSLLVAWRFGVSLSTIAALVFTWCLIALALIDLHEQLLPDDIVYPLLWMGMLYSFSGDFTSLQDSVIGAVAGYMSLWLVFQLFKLITGKEGMGYGDFKLLAALGAWCGWQLLPLIILLSSVVGAVTGIIMLATGRTRRAQPIPFGPYLAAAGWIALLWGPQINSAWLGMMQ